MELALSWGRVQRRIVEACAVCCEQLLAHLCKQSML
jgi:hypothetical protein